MPTEWKKEIDHIKKIKKKFSTIELSHNIKSIQVCSRGSKRHLMEKRNAEENKKDDLTGVSDAISQFGGHIRTLILRHAVIETGELVKLINMADLKEFIIAHSYVSKNTNGENDSNVYDGAGITLNSLILVSNGSRIDYKFFDLLTSLKVQSRKIVMIRTRIEPDNRDEKLLESFQQFMTQQKILNEFVMDGDLMTNYDFIADQLKDKKIEKLAIKYHHNSSSRGNDTSLSVSKFIESHQHHLKELELHSYIVTEEVTEAINQCRSLQKLYMYASDDFKVNMATIQPNSALKTLVFSSFKSPQTMEAVFRMFPDIENLSLCRETLRVKSNVFIIATQSLLKSVKRMSVPQVYYSIPEVTIENLEVLQVNELRSMDELQIFLYHNPSLQSLKINSGTNGLSLMLPHNHLNLKEVNINLTSKYIDQFDERLRQKLQADCPNLRKITLYSKHHDYEKLKANAVHDSIEIVVSAETNRWEHDYGSSTRLITDDLKEFWHLPIIITLKLLLLDR